MFGFSSWPSHDVYWCLLIQISLAILGRQPLGPVIGFIRWAVYLPILFTSFSCRMWILFGGITMACHLLYDESATGCLVNSWALCLSLNVFTCWWRFAMEFHISVSLSSALLIISVIILSERFTTSFISDIIPSKISLSSDLDVGQWCAECDHEWSSLSFCLKRWDIFSHSLGGSCPDPPWAVLSGTALPLPLSGGMTLYSSLMSLILGDSCAPASDPPLVGGGFCRVHICPL